MIILLSTLALAQDSARDSLGDTADTGSDTTSSDTAPPPAPSTEVEATSPFHELTERWVFQPYWDPVGSLSMYGGAGNQVLAWNLGLEGGVQYADTQSRMVGKTRARAMGMFVGGLAGSDLRVGSFVGPQENMWALMSGLDVFRNGFTSSRVSLPMSWGVELPVVVTFGPPGVAMLFGVSTAWLVEPTRRVNWDQTSALGFGHEFGWEAGVAVAVGSFHIAASYSKRQTSRGPVQGFGGSIGF